MKKNKKSQKYYPYEYSLIQLKLFFMIFEILLVKYTINNTYFDISCKVCS